MPLLSVAAVYAALCGCTLQAFAGGPATTTALTFIANGRTVTTLVQGNPVTLTAAVIAGGTPLTVGQVEFCDASPYCTDIHLLALAQLTSAGTATFRFIPRAGTQHYKAVFLGTNSYATSNSGVQVLTVTPGPYKYISSSTLVASGSPGSYTLTDDRHRWRRPRRADRHGFLPGHQQRELRAGHGHIGATRQPVQLRQLRQHPASLAGLSA